MKKIKKIIFLISFIGVFILPLTSFATLTKDQINAILNLLIVFNVPQDTIANVRNILLSSITPDTHFISVSTTTIVNTTTSVTNSAVANLVINPQTTSTIVAQQQKTINMPQRRVSIFDILPIRPEYENWRFASDIDPSLLTYDNLKRLFDEGGGLIVWKSQKSNTYLITMWGVVDPNTQNIYFGEGDWVLLYNPLYSEDIQTQLNSSQDSWAKLHPEAIQRLQEYLTKYPNAFVDPH